MFHRNVYAVLAIIRALVGVYPRCMTAATIQKMALKNTLSISWTRVLLSRMERRGVVKILRGSGGGFCLGVEPAKLRLSAVKTGLVCTESGPAVYGSDLDKLLVPFMTKTLVSLRLLPRRKAVGKAHARHACCICRKRHSEISIKRVDGEWLCDLCMVRRVAREDDGV
jgi:hypothetical protein